MINISIVVVAYNEEENIAECLSSLLKLDYPSDSYEIIVVDGCSTDKTQDIVLQYTAKDDRVRMIANPKRTISSNRNVGIKNAKYDFIAFTDADCIVPAHWLKKLSESFVAIQKNEPFLTAVGGGNTSPDKANAFTRAVGIAMDSYLGSLGSAQGKSFQHVKLVPSLPCLNVLYKKDNLTQIGGFDESLGNITEDYELNFRLRQSGYKLAFIPDNNVYHKFRPTVGRFWKQMFHYGVGRGRLIRRNPVTFTFTYLLPLLFLAAMGSSVLTLISYIFLLPLIYFPVVLIITVFLTIKKNAIHLAFHTFLALLIIHFAYSIGEFIGLIRT